MGKLGEQCPRSDLKRRDRCEKSATDAAYKCENCRKEYVRRKWFDKHQKVCKRNDDPQGWKQVSLKKWLRTSPEQQQQHPVSTENRFWPLRLHQKGGYPDRLKIIIFANNDTTNNERKSEIITSLNIPKNVRIRFRGKKGGARTELWFPSRRDLLAYFEGWGKKGEKLGLKMRLGRTYSERERHAGKKRNRQPQSKIRVGGHQPMKTRTTIARRGKGTDNPLPQLMTRTHEPKIRRTMGSLSESCNGMHDH